jgi:hypothetical protein
MYKYNNMLAISVGIKAKCPLRKKSCNQKRLVAEVHTLVGPWYILKCCLNPQQ